jgi:dTDP-glucose 4,6-dehydratase
VKNRIVFVQDDIADRSLVDELVKKHGIEYIIDFAAETHVDRSIADAAPFLHTNILGVQSLIEVCRSNPNLKLLHISTDEVYGDLNDADPPNTVEDPLWPSSPYAASKAAGDLLIQAAARTYGIKACISRCTNNYGPHQANEKFIPTVIHKASHDEPVPIYAQGKNKRDWLYVTDHTDAIEVILRTSWAFDECHIFNVSADEERENIAVAKEILSVLGKPESLLSFVKDRPGHDWRYALDSSATRKLGWKPKVDFPEGIRRTIAWYQSVHS